MKLGALFSGGKDSTMALYKAMQEHDVKVLVALKSERDDSYMFHIPNIDLVKVQAQAIGLPLVFERTSGEKEKELRDLKNALLEAKEKYGIEGVVAGALASEYQKQRIERICEELSLKVFTPYWHKDSEQYMREIISAGFEVIITGVAAEGLSERWLGRKIDESCIMDLKKLHEKFKVHIAFEGGEAETLVVDGPIFEKRLEILETKKKWDGMRGELIVGEVKLVDKG